MSDKKNILLCVAGATPQIITETLYDLTIQQGKRIDEIRVITTLDGRDKIMTGAIKGRGSVEESLLDKKQGKFFEFLRDYPQISNIEFNEKKIALLRTRDGQTLEDIRTLEENELAGDQICEIVRELCKDENTRIFASAAGGRKTMSIYLTLAMSLFGRAEDELSHVLVNQDFEMNPQFFYPTPTPQILKLRDGREVSTSDARIYLAPISFIRFRGINVNLLDSNTYQQAVEKAQTALKLMESAEYEFQIDLQKNIVKVVETTSNLSSQVKLSLREVFMVSLFAKFRLNEKGEKGFVAWNEINDEDLLELCEEICLVKGQMKGETDFSFLPKSDFIERLLFRVAPKFILDKKTTRFRKIKNRKPDKGEIKISKSEVEKSIIKVWREILGKLNEKLDAVFPQNKTFEQFYIQRKGEKESHTYGYDINEDKIVFIPKRES